MFVFQGETLTQNGILDTEMPDFPNWFLHNGLLLKKEK